MALLLSGAPSVLADTPAPLPPAQQGPLKPGKSAGVTGAQRTRAGLALIGAGAIIAIVAVTTTAGSGGGAGNQPNNQSVPTTTP